MMAPEAANIEHNEMRRSLERLSAHASAEILAKQPHWGDAILSDGLLYAARALKTDAPVAAAQQWFAPKLAQGPRTSGWFWFWAAEALPALDLHETDRKSTRLNSSHEWISYAVFCLK